MTPGNTDEMSSSFQMSYSNNTNTRGTSQHDKFLTASKEFANTNTILDKNYDSDLLQQELGAMREKLRKTREMGSASGSAQYQNEAN